MMILEIVSQDLMYATSAVASDGVLRASQPYLLGYMPLSVCWSTLMRLRLASICIGPALEAAEELLERGSAAALGVLSSPVMMLPPQFTCLLLMMDLRRLMSRSVVAPPRAINEGPPGIPPGFRRSCTMFTLLWALL